MFNSIFGMLVCSQKAKLDNTHVPVLKNKLDWVGGIMGQALPLWGHLEIVCTKWLPAATLSRLSMNYLH